jgi:hypothetical protein
LAGLNREEQWHDPREVCWQTWRGALAKIERCAGKE